MGMPYTAIQFTVLHKLKTFAAGSSKTGVFFKLNCVAQERPTHMSEWSASLCSEYVSHILIYTRCFVLHHAGEHLKLSPYLSYVSGALAGCAATVGSYPFDLLRTILASQGEPKVLHLNRAKLSYQSSPKKYKNIFSYVRLELVDFTISTLFLQVLMFLNHGHPSSHPHPTHYPPTPHPTSICDLNMFECFSNPC